MAGEPLLSTSASALPQQPDAVRARTFQALANGPLDLLVVGGGIVGSGIARDAAMRGLRVGLVEQHDFAFGTSSRSSRLLHGGLRYLAQGRVGLVHEASVEKKVVHEIAPHLAGPLAFIFPAYRGNRDWVLWQLKVGVKIYDLLCGGRNLGKSTWLGTVETVERVPGLQPKDLLGAVRYYDGFTNDARLTLDTLRSAAGHGALCLNYCRFKNAAREKHWTCELVDCLSGESHVVQARAVANATGPWADGLPHSRVKLRLTKGVHLVVERERLPVRETVVMTEGKRILFAIPWGERTILGTTDTDYQGSLEYIGAEAADVAYVLEVTNRHFPGAHLTPEDVISTWAGVRPLIDNGKGKPSDISRSHRIRTPEPGWWDVAGGKLTTYRLMAEQTTDEIVRWLRQAPGFERGIGPCRTAAEPLVAPGEAGSFSGIVPPEVSRAAVEHYALREWAVHLEDVMVRRSSWHYYWRNAAAIAEQAAGWMAETLGWTPEMKERELEQYLEAHQPRPRLDPIKA